MEPPQGHPVTLGMLSSLSLSSLKWEWPKGLPSKNALRIKIIIRIKRRHLVQRLAQSNLLSNSCYTGIEGFGDEPLDGKPAPRT